MTYIQSAVQTTFNLAFGGSPVILTGGVASAIPGGGLPIITVLQALAEGVNVINSVTSGTNTLLNQFATFEPLPGSNLISQQVAAYPFASQAVAANASITTPLSVGLRMLVPAQGQGGYLLKTATMVALKSLLDAHIAAGGLFTVLTPSYVYIGCLLLDLRDATAGETVQKQIEWDWQFQQPLTQQQQLTQVLSNLMNKISGGLPTDNRWSSTGTAIGSAVTSVQSGISSIGSSLGSAIGI
jgi:hypothetical protein